MVSSGMVNSDSMSFMSSFSNFDSSISGLSAAWQGDSYNNFKSQVADFSSSFSTTITQQMNSFAKACDLYLEYKSAKDNLKIAQSNYAKAADYYNRAASCNDSTGMGRAKSDMNRLKTEIDKYIKIMEEKKVQIQASLQEASSEKLDASSISTSNSSAFGTSLNSAIKNWADDNNFVYYNQGAGWADYKYSAGGSNTMGKSGCGPCAAAMVMASFGKNVTPNEAADWSAENGYHDSSGTDHEFFTAYSEAMGVPCESVENVTSQNVSTSLGQGNLVILNVGPGDFTSNGHFIVARGYNSETNEVLVADPGHKDNCHWWNLDLVASQTKSGWVYSPK